MHAPVNDKTKSIWLHDHFCCPECRGTVVSVEQDIMVCGQCNARYPIAKDRPVLLRQDNPLFPPDGYVSGSSFAPPKPYREYIRRLVPSISVNLGSKGALSRFATLLKRGGDRHILVIGGGTQKAWLDERFSAYPNVRLYYCDVDANASVDVFCDAHELPFRQDTFDGVILTAVIEHVMYPERVAEEIRRVLMPGGLVYSEAPFMQQVHEGAYDFTRYTLSGHRRLFNNFREIDSGMIAGPATSFLWSLENLLIAFIANQYARLMMKSLVRMSCFWIKYLDYYLSRNDQAMDGASCTYFLGSKQEQKVSDTEIIARYRGAIGLKHSL